MSAKRSGGIGGSPRVDLLPPEVAQRTKDQSALSWSLLLLVAVIGLIVVGVAFAALRNTTAQAALTTAQSQGAAIVAEQLDYVEIREVNQSIEFIEAARIAGTSTEIDWVAVLAEFAPVMPPDTTVWAFNAHAPDPWTPSATPSGLLRAPLAGSITVTLRSTSVDAIARFATAVKQLDIVADASFDTITTDAYIDGVVTVNLNELALAHRFVDEEAQE